MVSSFIPKPIHYTNAKALGVRIKPSYNRKKKLDVFDYHFNYICSIGATGYGDYESYTRTHGIEYANERRRLYKQRHEKTRHVLGSASYYADKILWE